MEVSEVPENEKESATATITVTDTDKTPTTTTPDQGPFADPPAKPSPKPSQSTSSLTAVGEEPAATEHRTPHAEKRNSSSSIRDQSPFSDKNALKDN